MAGSLLVAMEAVHARPGVVLFAKDQVRIVEARVAAPASARMKTSAGGGAAHASPNPLSSCVAAAARAFVVEQPDQVVEGAAVDGLGEAPAVHRHQRSEQAGFIVDQGRCGFGWEHGGRPWGRWTVVHSAIVIRPRGVRCMAASAGCHHAAMPDCPHCTKPMPVSPAARCRCWAMMPLAVVPGPAAAQATADLLDPEQAFVLKGAL